MHNPLLKNTSCILALTSEQVCLIKIKEMSHICTCEAPTQRDTESHAYVSPVDVMLSHTCQMLISKNKGGLPERKQTHTHSPP